MYLHLENGEIFKGKSIGATGTVAAMLVVDTLSYQEELSNPANFGKILCFTIPTVGTYGINTDDLSDYSASGAVFHSVCDTPSNFRSTQTLSEYLAKRNIVGITDIDTRRITTLVREQGALRAVITPNKTFDKSIFDAPYKHPVKTLSVNQPTSFGTGDKRIAVLDLGINRVLLSMLSKDNTVVLYPYNTAFNDLIADKPDAIVVSGGTGCPNMLPETHDTMQKILSSGLPTLVTGFAHNAFAAALGLKNTRLARPCRGGLPNRNLKTTSVFTAHCTFDGYVTEVKSDIGEVLYTDVHDGFITGIKYNNSVTSVQFNPECNKYDTHHIIEGFLKRI